MKMGVTVKVSFINKALNWFNNSQQKTPYDEVPDYRISQGLYKNPWIQQRLIDTSIEQDRDGSHYHGILNTVANDCIGPQPLIIGENVSPILNDDLENTWRLFCEANGIGASLRLLRRAAARTGIGIGVPYLCVSSVDPVKIKIKIISRRKLKSPLESLGDPSIVEGIRYDQNWDPEEIFLNTGESYLVKDILFWYKRKDEEETCGVPEAAAAMCILPSVKRYISAIIRSKEFRSSMPMALTLDPQVWGKESMEESGIMGTFDYEPGIVPTLPPGTKLEGIPNSSSSDDDDGSVSLMVGTAARCFNMPMNLATGNSSKHNMASSQVDLGPWKTTVDIDRSDFAPNIHHIFTRWFNMGVLIPGYFTQITRQKKKPLYKLAYANVFTHPDPLKIANANMVKLKSGEITLTEIYTSNGENARRAIEREATLYGKTYEEMCDVILSARSNTALQIIAQDLQPDTGQI